MSNHKWSEEKERLARQLRSEGLSYVQIGLRLGVDNTTVRKHLNPQAGLYSTWMHIKRRCYDPADERYRHYGARGISMWEPWVDGQRLFAADVIGSLGERPTPRHTLDRINNDGNYEPGNLRWALPREQSLNRSGCSPWPNISVSKPKVFAKKISPYLLKVVISKVFVSEEDATGCAEALNKEFGDVIAEITKRLEAWPDNTEVP